MLSRLDQPLVPLEIDGGLDSFQQSVFRMSEATHVEGLATTVYVLDRSGSYQEQSGVRLLDLAQSLWPGGTHKSYFRLLKSVADATQGEFALKIEKRAVVVHSDMMRALVEPTRAILFGADANPTRFQTLLDEMVNCIQAVSQAEDGAFACAVVESVVCAQVTMQTARLKVLKPVALDILSAARRENSHEAIMELYPVQVALSSFVERLRPVVRCLQPSLDPWSLAADEGSEGPFEELLEAWHHNAKEVLDDATELVSNLADTMSFIESSLNCYQNRLMRLDYTVMVPTMALTFWNLVAAIFGMNLDGGGADPDDGPAQFWLDKGYFEGAQIICLVICSVICAILLRSVHQSRNFYKANSTKFGNNQFFRKVGDDNYVLTLASSFSPDTSHRCVADLDRVRPEVRADLAKPALPVKSKSRVHW